MESFNKENNNVPTQNPAGQAAEPSNQVIIDRDGFDRIVTECIDEQMRDPKLREGGGLSLLLFPMIGASFASLIRKKLFGDQPK